MTKISVTLFFGEYLLAGENQSTYAQRDTQGLTSRLNKPQYMVG